MAGWDIGEVGFSVPIGGPQAVVETVLTSKTIAKNEFVNFITNFRHRNAFIYRFANLLIKLSFVDYQRIYLQSRINTSVLVSNSSVKWTRTRTFLMWTLLILLHLIKLSRMPSSRSPMNTSQQFVTFSETFSKAMTFQRIPYRGILIRLLFWFHLMLLFI